MTTPTTPDEALEAIREALAAGPTPGPWAASFDGHGGVSIMSIKWQIGFASKAGGKQEANAALIAACNPEAITALLDALNARDAEIKRLRGVLGDVEQYMVNQPAVWSVLELLKRIRAAIDQARATGGETANG